MTSIKLNIDTIKTEARRLGFSACGLAEVDRVDEMMEQELRQYLAEGRQAEMHYLENHLDKRLDPRLLVEGAQSLVSLALNYYPHQLLRADQMQFAYYAYGKDYHIVMKKKLHTLLSFIQQTYPGIEGRAFCDTAPLLERYWAWKSGLGWIGKNKQLVIPHQGSYFFLGELILTAPTDSYDTPLSSHCGSCRACIDACPTQLLGQTATPFNPSGKWNKCLSYLTIEHRGDIPPEAKRLLGNSIYGCDRCQTSCPHNRFATPTNIDEFTPSSEFLSMEASDWQALDEVRYRRLFKDSAVKRAKFQGLIRNISAHCSIPESSPNDTSSVVLPIKSKK